MITNKNLFIVLEGIDHSGKTSVANKLHKILGGVKIAFPKRDIKTGKEIDNYWKGKKVITTNNTNILNNENMLNNTNNISNNNNNLLNNKHIHILLSNNR